MNTLIFGYQETIKRVPAFVNFSKYTDVLQSEDTVLIGDSDDVFFLSGFFHEHSQFTDSIGSGTLSL